jgi:hypothetical protein
VDGEQNGVRSLRPKALLGLGAALVVLVAVATVFMLSGIRRPPSFASLADQPDEAVKGWLLFNRYHGDEICLIVRAAGGGEERQISCSLEPTAYMTSASVDGDGRVLIGVDAETSLLVDPHTGAIIDRAGADTTPRLDDPIDTGPNLRTVRSDGAEIEVRNDFGNGSTEVVVRRGSAERTILQVSGPPGYGLYNAEWSPDGNWVIAEDTMPVTDGAEVRYVLIDADSDAPPRTLFSDPAELGEPPLSCLYCPAQDYWGVTWIQSH